MPSTPLTRTQIYAIRDRAAQGESAPRILREMGLPVSLETVRRVIRRDSHREIGVGSAERSFVSNRLSGESRATGDYVPAYHRPHIPDSPEVVEQLARLREVTAAMRAQPRDLGAMPDPFDLPEPTGPTAEELIATRVEATAQAPLAPFETADDLIAQIAAMRQRA